MKKKLSSLPSNGNWYSYFLNLLKQYILMGHSSLNCEMQILNTNMHLTHIQKHQHYTFVFCSLHRHRHFFSYPNCITILHNTNTIVFISFLDNTVYQYSLPLAYWYSDSKESGCNTGDMVSIPGWGRSAREGNDIPVQCSCLENSMDREAWWDMVHRVAKSRTQLSD